MNKNVLFDYDLTAANKEIKALEERREIIAMKLRALKEAVKSLIRKEPTLADLERYLELSNDEINLSTARALAFETYFRMEDVKINIDPRNAHLSMSTPPEVMAVVNSWQNIVEISSDPKKYWSATSQDFKAKPVSKEEKEGIKKRNELYAKSKDAAEIAEHVEKEVKMINYLNRYFSGQILPVKLAQNSPWLYQLVVYKVHGEGGPRTSMFYEYKLDRKKFFEPYFEFKAFDEG